MLFTVYYLLWILLGLGAIAHLLVHKREPSSTLAWLFFVITVPVFGPLIFFILGPQRLERNAIKRKSKLYSPLEVTGAEPPPSKTRTLLKEERKVFEIAERISGYEFTEGNSIAILPDPSDALKQMSEAISNAKSYVHLEYYIISSDEVTKQLFEDLIAAKKRGVEVRVLYDSLGSYSLKRRYFKPLQDNGIKISGFLPFSLAPQRLNFNFRNHRKILIIDGKVAFCGGTNIGRQYLGRPSEHQWRDYTFEVQGPVCLQMQDVFAKDWQFTTEEDLADEKYYPKPTSAGDAVIQLLESGPDTEFHILHRAVLMGIHSAKKRVWLTTPYFIPDTAMLAALEIASLRGVDVKLILPAKNDAPVVQAASRSFYDSLFRSGIKLYEYQPRVLHAKTMLVDEDWTLLGSANMDIRSFRLNFELNLFVYSHELAAQLEKIFLQDLSQSKAVVQEEFDKRPVYKKIFENTSRLLTPIL